MAKITKCPHCKEEIPQSAKKCPKCGKKISKPPIILFVLGGIVFLIIIYNVLLKNDTNSSTAALEEKAKIYKIGETINNDGKLEITISKVSKRKSVGFDFMTTQPAEGAVYLCIEYNYKNISGKPINGGVFSSIFDLELKSPDGTIYDTDAMASGVYATELNNSEKIISDLNPGIKVSGSVVYEIAITELAKPGWTLTANSLPIDISSIK